jgi:hypothetical protein
MWRLAVLLTRMVLNCGLVLRGGIVRAKVLELVVLFYEAVLYTRMYLSWRPCTSRRSCRHLWPRIAILYARMVLNWRSCMRVGSCAGGLISRRSCMRVWT